MPDAFTRESLADGSRLSTDRCTITFRRETRSVLKVTISGHDTGQFGPAVFDEIRLHLGTPASLELFVDATAAEGPTAEVSEAWTKFLSKEAPHLKRVSVLAVDKFVHLTVSIAKLFSRTGELMQVYSNPELFQAALERATGKKARHGI